MFETKEVGFEASLGYRVRPPQLYNKEKHVKHKQEKITVAHTYNPRTCNIETGVSEIQGYPASASPIG